MFSIFSRMDEDIVKSFVKKFVLLFTKERTKSLTWMYCFERFDEVKLNLKYAVSRRLFAVFAIETKIIN